MPSKQQAFNDFCSMNAWQRAKPRSNSGLAFVHLAWMLTTCLPGKCNHSGSYGPFYLFPCCPCESFYVTAARVQNFGPLCLGKEWKKCVRLQNQTPNIVVEWTFMLSCLGTLAQGWRASVNNITRFFFLKRGRRWGVCSSGCPGTHYTDQTGL